ncbi:probable disease resistance protein At5g66900 [Gastrolobium bilobum]|uniref:probable disease resistance protein At5g66900 n=1 Tax=Gastrolobium bilobum TaxID=150636 RepID=UPI002AB1D61A|nr:probable disease resistance protein At5g66900 [Gastrolobium bilobum]
MDLLSEGAVGTVMGEMLEAALEAIQKGREFRPTLESNIETLNSLTPLLEEMKRYSKELDHPIEEIEKLETEIRAGEELVQKCSKLSRWRFLSFPHNQSKLKAKDESLKRCFSFNVQAENTRNLMEILTKVGKILEILLSKENFEEYQIKGLSGAPEEPQCIGMDEPLNKLKIELLKDGESVLLLTGLGGSGKSTLAKKLCWDPQIKGKFGENIFFVTVSETPNLKTIVQTLFEHCGCRVPQFQSDEDAINRLGLLLRLVAKNPTLLVLDDVSSETLVDKFIFQLSDYKILVTSRFAFQRFGTPCQLDPLRHDHAVSLFHHFVQRKGHSSYMPDENLVNEIVRGCKGSPLAVEVIAGSLCQQPFEVWKDMKERLQNQSILESGSTDLYYRLQQSLDTLKDKFSINEKECFMDLGLFPEDQRIPVTALIDMWTELHNLDEDGRNAMTIVHDLSTRNLIKVIVTRKVAKDEDMYYNNHFVMLHDLLRELAIHLNKREPFEQRKRLIIDLNGDNRPKWWVGQNQQGIIGSMFSFMSRIGSMFSFMSRIGSMFSFMSRIGSMFSFMSRMLRKQKQLKVAARILSISTDETFNSDWCDMQPDEAEVQVLNISSRQYTLPEFTDKMSKLKVLIVTNYGFHPTELNKFELLGFLSNLKRIRLEKVSVPCLCILKNLRKLSLRMCKTKQAFESYSIQISNAMPNLVEMSIDYCNDLVKLPDGLCNIKPLKKLSITNCHKLSALPQEIAKLENLEVLRLCSCSDLVEMPDSVGGLNKLCCFDISDCVSLSKLPDDIGDLQKLEKLYMKGCSKLSELPDSIINFGHFKHKILVICDEERAALWKQFPSIPNLIIEMPEVGTSLDWLPGVYS